MVVYAGHPLAYQHPVVGDQSLLLQPVQHRVQGTLLGFQPSAAAPFRLLHQLVAVHIFPSQQRQQDQRHDAALEYIGSRIA